MREAIIGIVVGLALAVLITVYARGSPPVMARYQVPPPDCARTSPPWGTADCYARQ